jgi:hypothetical protein
VKKDHSEVCTISSDDMWNECKSVRTVSLRMGNTRRQSIRDLNVNHNLIPSYIVHDVVVDICVDISRIRWHECIYTMNTSNLQNLYQGPIHACHTVRFWDKDIFMNNRQFTCDMQASCQRLFSR